MEKIQITAIDPRIEETGLKIMEMRINLKGMNRKEKNLREMKTNLIITKKRNQ